MNCGNQKEIIKAWDHQERSMQDAIDAVIDENRVNHPQHYNSTKNKKTETKRPKKRTNQRLPQAK
jgi:hypothetical protein